MLHNLYHTQKKIQKHLTLISLLQFKPLILCLSTMDRESRWFPPFLWQPWQLPPCFPGQSTLQMLSLFHISSSLFFSRVLFIPTAPPGLSLMVRIFFDLNDILIYSCNPWFATIIWTSQPLLQPASCHHMLVSLISVPYPISSASTSDLSSTRPRCTCWLSLIPISHEYCMVW